MHDIIHRTCGGVAFRYTERPIWGTPIVPAKARLLDGSTPIDGTLIYCGSCGENAVDADLAPEDGW